MRPKMPKATVFQRKILLHNKSTTKQFHTLRINTNLHTALTLIIILIILLKLAIPAPKIRSNIMRCTHDGTEFLRADQFSNRLSLFLYSLLEASPYRFIQIFFYCTRHFVCLFRKIGFFKIPRISGSISF